MHNILIFGDSISAGREIEKIKCWPFLLTQFLDAKDKNFTLVHNLSIPGDSTSDVIKRFPVEAKARCKKIYPDNRVSIIFAIGINDAKCVNSKDKSVTKLDDFRKNIGFLAKSAAEYTNHIIFVGITPVDEQKAASIYGANNIYFLNDKIKIYNEVINEECQKRNIIFLNIVKEWSEFDYASWLSEGGVHPNEKGHQKIFEKIKPLFA